MSRLMIYMCLSLFVLLGCNKDDPTAPQRQPLQATSKTELLALFRTAYDDMDLDGYTDLLHEDYEFSFLGNDCQTMYTWHLTEELQCATHMFSGETIINAQGKSAVGISNIEISQFDTKSWEALDSEDPLLIANPGAEAALCAVTLVWYYEDPDTGGTSTFTVSGYQKFIVTPVIRSDDSEIWKMLRQVDTMSLLSGKANEDSTWSDVKLLYL